MIEYFIDNPKELFKRNLKELDKETAKLIKTNQKINHKNNEIILELEVPGVKKEDIEIFLEENNLVIIINKKELKEEHEEYLKIESFFGQYKEIFSLPENTDFENITSKLENGILKIIIPLKKEKKRLIKIN